MATVLESNPRSQALQQWQAKEKRNFFSSISCFFKLFYYYSSSKVATKATHNMTASSKTYKSAQPRCKPQNPCTKKANVCGVASFSADLVLQSNLVCVCVCMLPRPKASSETSFGTTCSFLPPKLQNSKLHNL
jgi:hypothetical protein